jgi:hypothetical protein
MMTCLSSSNIGFESLPIELHCMILCYFSDFYSLRSVVVASRIARTAFVSSAQPIQYNVLRRLLLTSPQLFRESAWLHAASHFRRNTPDWHDKMDDFLACNDLQIDFQLHPHAPGGITPEGLRFHLVVQWLTSNLLSWAVQAVAVKRKQQPNAAILAPPLQYTERIRIQRSFYRFQRVCQMFRPYTQNLGAGQRPLGEHVLWDFFRTLPEWEIEELCCVYRFLLSKLPALDHHEHSRNPFGRSIGGRVSNFKQKERVISLGLIFVHEFLTASADTRSKLLSEYCTQNAHWLTGSISLRTSPQIAGPQEESRNLRSRSLFGPSAGWTLFRPSSSKHSTGVSVDELRDWGFCFWDRDLLDAWGLHEEHEEGGTSSIAKAPKDMKDNKTEEQEVCNKASENSTRISWIERILAFGYSLRTSKRPQVAFPTRIWGTVETRRQTVCPQVQRQRTRMRCIGVSGSNLSWKGLINNA